MTKIRIVVLGQTGVGKSTLINTFIKKEDSKEYEPTVEEVIEIDFCIDKKKYPINILDTSGLELFYGQRKLYINEGDAFILVYSVTDPKSFHYIINVYQNILLSQNTMRCGGRPITIVGMKSDLVKERRVSTNEGINIASKLGVSFLETNKFNQSTITDAFISILNQNIYLKVLKQSKFIEMNNNKIKISNKENEKLCVIM